MRDCEYYLLIIIITYQLVNYWGNNHLTVNKSLELIPSPALHWAGGRLFWTVTMRLTMLWSVLLGKRRAALFLRGFWMVYYQGLKSKVSIQLRTEAKPHCRNHESNPILRRWGTSHPPPNAGQRANRAYPAYGAPGPPKSWCGWARSNSWHEPHPRVDTPPPPVSGSEPPLAPNHHFGPAHPRLGLALLA